MAVAERAGKSIGDYILDRALQPDDEARAMIELERFLAPRVAEALSGGFSQKSVREIAQEVYRELNV